MAMTEFEPQTVLLCFIQCATAAAQTNTYEKNIFAGFEPLAPKLRVFNEIPKTERWRKMD